MSQTDPIPRTGNLLLRTGTLVAAGALALSACGGSKETSPTQEIRDVACKVVDEIAEGTPDGSIDTSSGFVTLEDKNAVNGNGTPTDASISINIPKGGIHQTPDAVCEIIQGGDVSVTYTNIPDKPNVSQDAGGWVGLKVEDGKATSVSGLPKDQEYSEHDFMTVAKALDVMSSTKSH